MTRERVPAGTPENPAYGPLNRERAHDTAYVYAPGAKEMTLVREDDPSAVPWGYRFYVRDVAPVLWIATEVVLDLVRHSDSALALEWEPKAEVTFRAGALFTLTLRAESGTWTWAFREFDHQREAYRLVWPD